jgi:hypothetical protein
MTLLVDAERDGLSGTAYSVFTGIGPPPNPCSTNIRRKPLTVIHGQK